MSTTFFSGFCQIHELVINGTTSPIGELTNKTMTYTYEPDYYYGSSNAGCDLVIFRGINGDNKFEKIPTPFQKPVTDVCDWLYLRAKAGKLTNSAQNCLQQLKVTFTEGYDWLNVSTMVTNNDIWMPSSIYFKVTNGDDTHEFKIWFANDFFRTEFPYREIIISPPLPVEEMNIIVTDTYKKIAARLAKETPDLIDQRMREAIDFEKYPPTTRFVKKFRVYDLINTPYYNDMCWSVAIYGNEIDADDEVDEAIREKNRESIKDPITEKDYEDRIPDLYNPTEFYVIPRYDIIGIPNETHLGSTNCPIVDFQTADKLALVYADLYDETHIKNTLQIIPFMYKSLQVGFVGKPRNHHGRIRIKDVIKEYQLIPSTDSQAGLMPEETTKFIFGMEELLAAGEIVTPEGIPPKGVTRVIKRDRLYIAKKIDSVKYTMISRHQLVKDGVIDE